LDTSGISKGIRQHVVNWIELNRSGGNEVTGKCNL
jgi:hypothetical protein